MPTNAPADRRVTAEHARLAEDAARTADWKRWGPYLADRQWGTVREDYSADGDVWSYFTHSHARSRAYRWGEDGLLGFSDRRARLCFGVALWNGRDPILKERLFGVTGRFARHGEDVKEHYFHVDGTPTHSYQRAIYKYPQDEFPYRKLVAENDRRGWTDPEYELADTGIFDGGRWFDVDVEYAKASPDDVLVRVTVTNRGPEPARVHVLPQLWFRNTWSWGCSHEDCGVRPRLHLEGRRVRARHPELGDYVFEAEPAPGGRVPEWLFTENETNVERLFGAPNRTPYVKDAFHAAVVEGRADAVHPGRHGTKCAAHHVLDLPAGGCAVLRLRLTRTSEATARPFGPSFDAVFAARRAEADAFHAAVIPSAATPDERLIARRAYAGLTWSKQFYHLVVDQWLAGDADQPPPPDARLAGRNADWRHLYARDVLSMPDKWEYPWFAAWDLAFHMIPYARIDPEFAKSQLSLLLREWYMHPNGQIPAYEFAFGDVNPPVHAWAVWRVYKMTGPRGARDTAFLESCFQKLLLNFTWWVNRKDAEGRHVFGGGFLGLDNIGIFDRSRPLPTGGRLEQADGTAWMAFYAGTMLSMALELARRNPAYEDIASKFFEHFVHIADAINTLDGTGLWDETDGFYHDHLHAGGRSEPLRVRSLVGLIPLLAVEILDEETFDALPGFAKRTRWFERHRKDLAGRIAWLDRSADGRPPMRLLAIPSRERLERVLARLVDEAEFLSPWGIRSVSRHHAEHPYVLRSGGEEFRLDYTPGEGTTGLFGGNSNWRGPVWFPINHLLVEALERYHRFYGDTLTVEFPARSGRRVTLDVVAADLSRRLAAPFLPDGAGHRPCHGDDALFRLDDRARDLVLFHEYFHAETGRGCGASHQTGWTALVAQCVEALAAARTATQADPVRAEAA